MIALSHTHGPYNLQECQSTFHPSSDEQLSITDDTCFTPNICRQITNPSSNIPPNPTQRVAPKALISTLYFNPTLLHLIQHLFPQHLFPQLLTFACFTCLYSASCLVTSDALFRAATGPKEMQTSTVHGKPLTVTCLIVQLFFPVLSYYT